MSGQALAARALQELHAERDGLQADLARMTAERDALARRVADLTCRCDQLRNAYRDLVEERRPSAGATGASFIVLEEAPDA
jgi:uncharacterized coiled-coil DUF342 family protein